MINAGTLALNPSSAFTYNNTISGAGSLDIGGQVTFGGTNTYLGATSVTAGTLTLNGSLTSAVTFANGANHRRRGLRPPACWTLPEPRPSPSTPPLPAPLPPLPSMPQVPRSPWLPQAAPPAPASSCSRPPAASPVPSAPNSSVAPGFLLSYNLGQYPAPRRLTRPPALDLEGNRRHQPTTFWDTDLTANWDNGGSPDKFLVGDNVLFNDTATSFTVAMCRPTILPGNVTFRPQ